MSIQELRSLSDLDLQKIGTGSYKSNGSFATVYEGLFPGTVIKRGDSMVDGWLIWALYCMSQTTEYVELPTIFRLHIDFRKKLFTAVMKELDEAYLEEGSVSVIKVATNEPINWEEYLEDYYIDLLKPHIEKCLSTYKIPLSYIRLDMHNNNYMEDSSGNLVINDPLSTIRRTVSDKNLPECSYAVETLFKKTPMPAGLTFTTRE